MDILTIALTVLALKIYFSMLTKAHGLKIVQQHAMHGEEIRENSLTESVNNTNLMLILCS